MDYPECERRGEDRIPVTVDDLSGDHGIGSLCQDDEPSRSEIEECLELLDEVWPCGEVPTEELPRELGRFKLLGELGRGGFGVVFLAEDELLGRQVAVKVPRVEV
jgi:serine/threonine protein kinase